MWLWQTNVWYISSNFCTKPGSTILSPSLLTPFSVYIRWNFQLDQPNFRLDQSIQGHGNQSNLIFGYFWHSNILSTHFNLFFLFHFKIAYDALNLAGRYYFLVYSGRFWFTLVIWTMSFTLGQWLWPLVFDFQNRVHHIQCSIINTESEINVFY